MTLREKDKSRSPEVDLTPMIDCVFNLLIFFMVINTMASIIGIKIDLPGEGGPSQPGAETLEVQIYHDVLRIDPERGPEIARKGILRVNGQATNLEQLANKIHYVVSRMAEKQDTLAIKADARTLHGTVVEVMDKAQDEPAHIKKFSLSEPSD